MKCFLIALVLFFATCSLAQKHHKCSVYVYQGTDSSHRQLCKETVFNDSHKVIAEYLYEKHKVGSDIKYGNTPDMRIFNFYSNDTLLVRSLNIGNMKDTSVKTYQYNGAGQLISDTDCFHIPLKYRVRENETQHNTIVLYKYDSHGHITEEKTANSSGGASMIISVYDDSGRLTSVYTSGIEDGQDDKYQELNKIKMIEYQYTSNGQSIIDYSNKHAIKKTNRVNIYNGDRVVREEDTIFIKREGDENFSKIGTGIHVYEYSPNKRLVKEVKAFDQRPIETMVYIYE